jgi:hypothetical protein
MERKTRRGRLPPTAKYRVGHPLPLIIHQVGGHMYPYCMCTRIFFCYFVCICASIQLISTAVCVLCLAVVNATKWCFVPGRKRFSPTSGDIGPIYYIPKQIVFSPTTTFPVHSRHLSSAGEVIDRRAIFDRTGKTLLFSVSSRSRDGGCFRTLVLTEAVSTQEKCY